jgi:hypothetical protein
MPQRYEVRPALGRRLRVFLGRVVVTIVVLSLIAGGGVLIFEDESPFDRLFSVGGIGVIILFAVIAHLVGFVVDSRPELVVETPGIRLGGAKVPWPSIWQVVVFPAQADRSKGGTEFGIRLRHGVPLPEGMHGVVYDPHRPQALHLQRSLRSGGPGEQRLAAAVRAFAPPEVEIVIEDPPAAPDGSRPAAELERQDVHALVIGVRMRDHSSTRSTHYRYKPHPVVSFTLPDGRHVVAETRKPGPGEPGGQVLVSYDVDDPTDVDIYGKAPKSTVRWTRPDGAHG